MATVASDVSADNSSERTLVFVQKKQHNTYKNSTGKRNRDSFSPEKTEDHEPKRQRTKQPNKVPNRSRLFGRMLFGTLKECNTAKPTEKESKRIELDSRIQATIDAERKQAMEIEEKKREERRKIEEERREQRRQEKERKRLIAKRKRIKYRFDLDHSYLITETSPCVLWIPAKHNIRTKKMLQERQSESFEEPFPDLVPYLPKESVSPEASPIRESLESLSRSRSPSRERESGSLSPDISEKPTEGENQKQTNQVNATKTETEANDPSKESKVEESEESTAQ